MSWPDGGTTPFRGEKDTNCEGGWRVPCAIRWPGVIKPGTVSNEIFSHTDMLPTLARGRRRAGHRREAQEGLQGRQQDLQGPHRRLQPAAVPEGRGEGESAQGLPLLERRRRPDGAARRQLEGARSWSSAPTGSASGRSRSSPLRVPKIYNLRSDPFERATKTRRMFYDKWMADRAFLLVPAQAIVGRVPQDVQGVPAAAEAGQLQHRPGAGEGAAEREAAGQAVGGGGK